jgi:hypothetical protein
MRQGDVEQFEAWIAQLAVADEPLIVHSREYQTKDEALAAVAGDERP